MKHDRNDHKDHTDRNTATLGDTRTMDTTSAGALAHLSDLDDIEIADGEPDVRGWDVKGPDGRKLGEVADLLVDTGAMKIRYMEVKLEEDVAKEAARASGRDDERTEPTRHVLVPVGAARLDDDDDNVRLDASAARLTGLPAYERGKMDREYESRLLKGYGQSDGRDARGDRSASSDDFYGGRQFDDRSFFGKRRQGRDDATYITHCEVLVVPAGQSADARSSNDSRMGDARKRGQGADAGAR